jgi:hypothetical protein
LGVLLARGVPYEESIKIAALISFQVLIGGEVWSRLNRGRAVGFFEFFGMGFAFGAIFFTVIDQMFITGCSNLKLDIRTLAACVQKRLD